MLLGFYILDFKADIEKLETILKVATFGTLQPGESSTRPSLLRWFIPLLLSFATVHAKLNGRRIPIQQEPLLNLLAHLWSIHP